MPNPIGVIIDPPNGNTGGDGIPAIKLDLSGGNTNQHPVNDRGNDTPEVIHGFETVDPDTIRIDTAAKRKPGRPRGSGNRSTTGVGTAATKTPDSLIDLSVLLVSLHQMGSALCGIEELELDKSEADTYADAIKELAKHYPHNVNPKALAWMNFACVVGGIYGTRFQAYRMRMKKERSTPAGGRVVEMNAQKATGTNGAPSVPTKPAAKSSAADPFAGLLTPSQLWNEPPVTGGGEF